MSAVTVHSGSIARVGYRADDTAGGAVTIDLLVTTRSGEVRRRLVTGKVARAGTGLVWRGRLRLRRGRYLLVAHAVDASGRSEASATAAGLRVLAPLPPLVPTARARRAAFTWASRRAGDVAVAVVDSRGRTYGYHSTRPFITASVVKAMLLVAYLRRHSSVDAGMRATLTRMITSSDNDAADAVYRSVGRRSLDRLARLAHMTTFRSSDAWIVCRVGAADMARFFRDMEGYVPRRHRTLRRRAAAADRLLSALGRPGSCGTARLPRVLQAGLAGRVDAGQRGGPPGAGQGADRPRGLHRPQPHVVLRQGDDRRRDRATAEALTETPTASAGARFGTGIVLLERE